ncbi:hypothetical protein SEVIR_5G358400v4 [Setaria viridis]|uniref:Uncharacterized protein n=1 Tax=Setaria viridis TaxID=4556 RepID=A0A4U6UM03_SETVI|nr:hypothetical protein SEVIR_5G358400v2 [Setaria viridis]
MRELGACADAAAARLPRKHCPPLASSSTGTLCTSPPPPVRWRQTTPPRQVWRQPRRRRQPSMASTLWEAGTHCGNHPDPRSACGGGLDSANGGGQTAPRAGRYFFYRPGAIDLNGSAAWTFWISTSTGRAAALCSSGAVLPGGLCASANLPRQPVRGEAQCVSWARAQTPRRPGTRRLAQSNTATWPCFTLNRSLGGDGHRQPPARTVPIDRGT